MTFPLDGEVAVDLSVGLAGGYATNMLADADAGATVIRVEPPDGDPLCRSSAHTSAAGSDGALSQFHSFGVAQDCRGWT